MQPQLLKRSPVCVLLWIRAKTAYVNEIGNFLVVEEVKSSSALWIVKQSWKGEVQVLASPFRLKEAQPDFFLGALRHRVN